MSTPSHENLEQKYLLDLIIHQKESKINIITTKAIEAITTRETKDKIGKVTSNRSEI